MEELERLREAVKEVDCEIIKLIGKRIDIIRQIGEKKKEQNIPLRNWAIEKSVIENAEALAHKLAIPVSLVKPIMTKLIEESRIEQELLHYTADNKNKEDILIIGGCGQMGQWFCSFFQNQGHNVSIFDLAGNMPNFKSYKKLEDGLSNASLAMVAVSLDQVPLVLDEIASSDYRGIVFDIASLKSHLLPSIEQCRNRGIKIASIHPMFGPGTRTLSDKVICFCDCGCSEANEKIKDLFQNTAATIVGLSLEEHDHLVSYVLGLSHIINIIFIKVLMKSGFTFKKINEVASTTFLAQLQTVESVIEENPILYYAIQRLNPYRTKLYENIKNAVNEITRTVLAGDGKNFTKIMEASKQWLKKI